MVLPVRPRRVPAVPLAAVAAAASTTAPLAAEGLPVKGVTHDSRQVLPGDLYAALPGAQAHGAAFARQAAERGAVAVLSDDLGSGIAETSKLPVLTARDPRAVLGQVASLVYGHPSRRLQMFGVTGTNGKTTVSYLLDAGLRGAGKTTGVIGTIGTRIAGETLPSARTTPEATDLQCLLAIMVEEGVEAVAMEVSSHAIAYGRAGGCHFAAALFTNLSQDHLDFHKTLDEYFEVKASLFTRDFADLAVVNVDDPWGRTLADRLAREPGTAPERVRTLGEQGDWFAQPREDGFRLSSRKGGRVIDSPLRLLGSFNLANAALALTALAETGVDPMLAGRGIGTLQGVDGRMERVGSGQVLALVDYAHTPDAVVTLLTALRPLTQGRLIAVLGCGGDRDRGKRPLMGAAVSTHADIAVLTDDNPRSEPSAAILASMEQGARSVSVGNRAQLVVESDRAAAIAFAVGIARPGDTLVVAGKGHETGQEVRGTVTPFDDRAVLRRALADAGWETPEPEDAP